MHDTTTDTASTTDTATTARRRPTGDDVLAGVDLTGRRALVTGGSSGLGQEIARALTAAGAEVTIAVRDVAAGEAAAERINATAQRLRPAVVELDLMSPESVAAAAAAWTGPLHILVANAGIMVPPEVRTPEGWESQFMTNYLGHFALITRLHPALAAAGDARVVLASSNAHLLGPVDVDELQHGTRPYEPWSAYAVSKTALILFAVESQKRWAEDGIVVTAYNPGFIPTGLQRNLPPEMAVSTAGAKTVPEGAAMPVFLAASPDAAAPGGPYYEELRVASPAVDEERDMSRPETFRGVADFAVDPLTATRLWNLSEAATRGW
jgi:NAD(P)-dependent dehydrogenase (short-subunit alcohol dehydrogenase family)